MGAFLDKPKTNKTTETFEGLGMNVALSYMQGWRVEQEDAHVVKLGLNSNKELGWFGVFDGHGGSLISRESAQRLDSYIDASSLNTDALGKTLREAFLKLDTDLRQLPDIASGLDHSGSTGVTCAVTPSHIVCANCGDSRAILVRDGKAVALSEDHKPVNPTEHERIVAAGGSVSMGRVNGDLAVSRALGDFMYKQIKELPDVKQQVSPEPDIKVVKRDDTNDQYIVLACDGIWDVFSNEDLAEWIQKSISRGCDDLNDMAEALLDEGLQKGSRDNMSVIIIAFKNAPKASTTAREEYKKQKAIKARQAESGANPAGEHEEAPQFKTDDVNEHDQASEDPQGKTAE